jgi:hypothetical protein
MTLLVRDEEDIVESNLEFHYAQGVDFVVATDNGSVDRTPAILEQYARRGRLRLVHEPDDTYAQARWVTRMARMAATDHGADWVINNDADEFWWPQHGDLRSTLAAVPRRYGVVRAPRVNFLPVDDEAGPFHRRMVVREQSSLNSLGQPLPPKACHRARARVTVAQGNHTVRGWRLRPLPGAPPITILHFPLRAYAQFENKIAKGGAAYERNREVPPGQGRTWRELYRAYRDGRLLDHYRGQVLQPGDAKRGLAQGRLVEDRRLQRFLDALPAADRSA